jgi:hypothetical protein
MTTMMGTRHTIILLRRQASPRSRCFLADVRQTNAIFRIILHIGQLKIQRGLLTLEGAVSHGPFP